MFYGFVLEFCSLLSSSTTWVSVAEIKELCCLHIVISDFNLARTRLPPLLDSDMMLSLLVTAAAATDFFT